MHAENSKSAGVGVSKHGLPESVITSPFAQSKKYSATSIVVLLPPPMMPPIKHERIASSHRRGAESDENAGAEWDQSSNSCAACDMTIDGNCVSRKDSVLQ